MASSNDVIHRRKKGLLPVHFWTPAKNKTAWQEFAKLYGQTLGELIEAAVARHIAHAPPVPAVPEPPPFEKPKRGRPKKTS